MRRKVKIVILLMVISILMIPITASAHSGRTDSNGGHKDNKNASGLGPYHYHCGGHPAHLHTNGVCPYSAPIIVKADSISIKNAPDKLKVGDSLKVEAIIHPESTNDKSITWGSSDADIATISSNGIITAVGSGSVVISAKTENGKIATFTLQINEIVIEESDTTISSSNDDNSELTTSAVEDDSSDMKINSNDDSSEIKHADDNNASIGIIGGLLVLSIIGVIVYKNKHKTQLK